VTSDELLGRLGGSIFVKNIGVASHGPSFSILCDLGQVICLSGPQFSHLQNGSL
jgi:hypothetical protein